MALQVRNRPLPPPGGSSNRRSAAGCGFRRRWLIDPRNQGTIRSVIQALSRETGWAGDAGDDFRADIQAYLLNGLISEIRRIASDPSYTQEALSERLANAGLLPMFGFPTRVRLAAALISAAARYRGDERSIVRSIGGVFRAAAQATRQRPAHHPKEAVRLAARGCQWLTEHGVDTTSQIGTLRDQAKPLLYWGLGWHDGLADARQCDRALHVLDVAEQRAGGARPAEGFEEEWLLTRLTRVEALVALGRGGEACQIWDRSIGEERLDHIIHGRAASPLGLKLAFTEMALCIARQDLTSVLAMANRFCEDPGTKPFADRWLRASALQEIASMGADSHALVETLLLASGRFSSATARFRNWSHGLR